MKLSKRSAIIDYPKKMYQDILSWVLDARKYWEDKQNRFDISDSAVKLERDLDAFYGRQEPSKEHVTSISDLLTDILEGEGTIARLLSGKYNDVEVAEDQYESYNESMSFGEFHIRTNDEKMLRGDFYIIFPVPFVGPTKRTYDSEETYINFVYDKASRTLNIQTIDPKWIKTARDKIYDFIKNILDHPQGGLYGHIEKTDEYDDGSGYYSVNIPTLELYPEFKNVSMKINTEKDTIDGILDFTKPLRAYETFVNQTVDLSGMLYKIEGALSIYIDKNKNATEKVIRFEGGRHTDFGESFFRYFPVDVSDTEQYKKHEWMKGIEKFYDRVKVVIYEKENPEKAGHHWATNQEISIFGVADRDEYSLKGTIKHELVHMLQTMITRALHALKPQTETKLMGLPGKYNPETYHREYETLTTEEGRKQHALSDIEFYSRLVSSIEKMKNMVDSRYIMYDETTPFGDKRFNELTKQEKEHIFKKRFQLFLKYDETLKYLHQHDPIKYQKMLRELYRQFEQIISTAQSWSDEELCVRAFIDYIREKPEMTREAYRDFQAGVSFLKLAKKKNAETHEETKMIEMWHGVKDHKALHSINHGYVLTPNPKEAPEYRKLWFVPAWNDENKKLALSYADYALVKIKVPFKFIKENGRTKEYFIDAAGWSRSYQVQEYYLYDGNLDLDEDNVIFLGKKEASVKIAKDPLKKYKEKRKFDETPEPERGGSGKNIFTIQDHHASHHHWDLRLQRGNVLESWAIPKHHLPSGGERLLATRVEPHPLDYAGFSGTIPKGEYGAGTVKVYQKGHYEPISWSNKKIEFEISSGKAKGKYVLIHTDGKKWLWMRKKDEKEK